MKTCLVYFFVAMIGTVSAQEVLSNTVAVLDFTMENPAADTGDWTAGVADYVELALEKQNIPALERRNIRLVLGERDLQAHALLSATTLSQARLPPVNFFVSGNVDRPAANEFVITISIIRADSATVESSLTRRGTYPADWLPAIESLAKEAGARLQIAKPEQPKRSEFEMMTWLPEAALPFFKGLEYYGRGDFASAAPWFRHSYEKDKHFDIARHWEARAYTKLNLFSLAEALSDGKTNDTRVTSDLKRPVTAIVASGKISTAGRAAFLQALAQSGQFELFDPASIGATAREIDLQLTGQMAAPLDGRSVWLVVDDLIFLDAPEKGSLVARQQNLISGELQQQVKVETSDPDEAGCAALAKAFLQNKKPATESSPGEESLSQPPEPSRQDQPEVALAKTLRLVQAAPDDARRWVGLADCYGDRGFKALLLNEAVNAIDRNRKQPEAAFWLASALWRKREMTKRIYHEPAARYHATNSLTKDFSKLLEWFPASVEARSLVEVTNQGEGSYTYVTPRDRSYLGAVFTNMGVHPRPSSTTVAPVHAPVVTDAQRLSRLNDYLREGRTAPAWQLANSLRTPDGSSVQPQVRAIYDNLLRTVSLENSSFDEFNAAIAAKQSQRTMELGRALLNCISRRQRADVIRKCGELIKEEKGVPEQLKFVFAEAQKYRDDFLLDPVTGGPGDNVEFQVIENTGLVMKVIGGPDREYERMVGEVAETAHGLPSSDLTTRIFEDIRNDKTLPVQKRLTAAYDLAMQEQAQGRDFEALELLKDVLARTEGTGMPLVRNDRWSETIERAAFEALRKIRIYADTGVDICDCCGKIPDAPPQKPANFEEMNRLLGQLWKQQIGEAGTNNPPIKQQLLARKEELLPTILYKLQTDQEVSHMLSFCGALGTNALPALPVIMKIIHRGEPFQDYNNALYALGSLGRSAACAKPLLILAGENSENGNFGYALKRIGPAPRRVMPLLAQLLYHKNPEICKLAASTVIETADLDKNRFNKIPDDQLVASIRKWWEEDGSSQSWGADP